MVALVLGLGAHADNDRVITIDRLPAAAQTLLKQHFAGKTPVAVTADRDDYTVVYNSGEKVEFDKKGNWKEIECRATGVPAALIPEQIKANVNTSFNGATIIELSRHRLGYEVKLNNGLDVEYNRSFQVVDVDD